MSEQAPQEERVSTANKLKIALGLGIVAGAGEVEVLAILRDNTAEAIAAAGLFAYGGFYAIKHFPESTQHFLGEAFGISFLKKKE